MWSVNILLAPLLDAETPFIITHICLRGLILWRASIDLSVVSWQTMMMLSFLCNIM